MAGRAFLLTLELNKQGKIVGSSKRKDGDLDFSQGVECFGFEYGVVTPVDPSFSGMPVGRRRRQPLTITKTVNSASPKLLQAAFMNEGFRTATLSFNRIDPGGKPCPVRKIELTNGAVVAVRPGGTRWGRNVENVTFEYGDIAVDGLRNAMIPRSMLG